MNGSEARMGSRLKGAEGPHWQQHAYIVGLTRVLPHWGMMAMISQEKKDNDSAVVVTEIKEKPPTARCVDLSMC